MKNSVTKSSEWQKIRLRFLLNNYRSDEEINRLKQSNDVTFLPMESVGERGGLDLSVIRPKSEVESGYTLFFDQDVLIAKITPCFENGKGALAKDLFGGIGYGTTELYVLNSGSELLPEFLFYLTISDDFRINGEAAMKGAAGQKRVPNEFIQNFRVRLPSLDIQQKISDYLDRETTQIDNLIAAKEQMLTLLKEKREALISHAVTRGLDPNVAFKRSGLDWLGDIPQHWEVKKLGYLSSLKSGDTITADTIAKHGMYPVYGGNGLRGYTDSFTHSGNYVLIGRQGALCGNINYAHGEFWASEHAVVVTPLEKCDYRWLGESLRNMNLNQYSLSAAQPGIAIDRISALKIAVPPFEEQQLITGYLDQETSKIDGLLSAIKESIALLKERRSALITAAVTGQIILEEMTS